MFRVITPGPLATLQDNGRHGYAHVGVPPAGAADMMSHALANRLVGNDQLCATVEVTMGGLILEARAPAMLAITGAATQVYCGTRVVALNSTVTVKSGDRIAFGMPSSGIRNYLAVRGGFDAPPTLGSRSTDLLSGLGPCPLYPGQALSVGYATGPPPPIGYAPVREIAKEVTQLRFAWGPRDDWFDEPSRQVLSKSIYRVEPHSNRIAVRLVGPLVRRAREGELPSEGVLTGCVQVPPEGLPLIFLNDHPTTGGYPIIGVVHPADLFKVAQLRSGDALAFRVEARKDDITHGHSRKKNRDGDDAV